MIPIRWQHVLGGASSTLALSVEREINALLREHEAKELERQQCINPECDKLCGEAWYCSVECEAMVDAKNGEKLLAECERIRRRNLKPAQAHTTSKLRQDKSVQAKVRYDDDKPAQEAGG